MNTRLSFPYRIILCILLLFAQGVQPGQAASSIPISSISLDKQTLTLALGGPSQALTPTIQPADASNQSMIWTSSKPEVATVSNGVVTPNQVGSTIIIATTDGGKIATCEVTVVRLVDGVSLNKQSLDMILGSPDETLTATVTPTNATDRTVRWESSNTSVITVDNGKVSAKSVGTATVTVTTAEGNFTDSCVVTVTAMPVSNLSLNKRTLTLSVSGSETLTPTIQPSNASNQSINWKSSHTDVATVDSSGTITAKAVGTTTIIAVTQDGGYTATCEVTVISHIPVSQVTLNRTSLTLYAYGSTATLVPTVSPSNASNKNVTWSSSNSSVASVNSSGVVTPGTSGTATITAITADGNKTAYCTVTVQSNLARNLVIRKRSSSSVDLSWSGTTGSVRVELKKRSNLANVDSTTTSDRTARFSGLSSSVEYNIYINDAYMDRFTLNDYDYNYDDDDEPTDVEIEKLSSSSVEITWRSTSGYVDVEIRQGSRFIDSERSEDRSARFYNLESDEDYDVYIDGFYVDDFELDDLDDYDDYDDYYDDTDDEVSSFRIVDKTSSSAEFSWRGTSGYVDVVLKRNGRVIDSVRTRDQSATFQGLSSDTEYDVYINGHFEDSFTTQDSSGTIRNFSVVKKDREQTIDLSWSGGDTPYLVDLRKDSIRVDSTLAFERKAAFSRLDYNQEYKIYINSKYMGSVKLDNPYSYADIKGHWAQAAIERLSQNQIIKGFSDGSFQPKSTVTREQFTVMLVQAKRYALESAKTTDFADLSPTHWSARHIQTAIKNGIIKPKEYGSRFQPARAITREEMAIMLARAQKLKSDAKAITFKDNEQINDKGLVGAVVKNGLIQGYPDNTFQPRGFLDRASAATVINKIFKSW